MNVENLRAKHPELLEYLKKEGYCEDYVNQIRRQINHILNKADGKNWNSYKDVYLEYAEKSESEHYLRNKRTFLGIIEYFDLHGLYPDRRRRQKIVSRESYHYLTEEFKAVIDYYCAAEKKRGKKDTVIYGESHNAATFLYTLQEKGIESLDDITEEAVLSVFVSPDGSLRRSGSYKKNIAAVFKACIPQDPVVWGRILSFLPKLRDTRKNIQYLSPEEITAVKEALVDKNSPLSLRNRAVGILAMNTGLRMCDIAGMTKDSIDWDNDLIFINQQKTDAPLELPLSAVTGNAIYDYLTQERPKTECEHIFISERSNDRGLKSASLGNISDKIMAAANIRQNKGDRRGFHIFRHRLATELLGKGVARPVISKILGHDSPDSLDTYLSADFKHLKECSISVERFPMSEGVFLNV